MSRFLWLTYTDQQGKIKGRGWRLQREKGRGGWEWGEGKRGEWRVPLDAVCNAAGRLPARGATEFQTCQSSWLSSLKGGKGREKFLKPFWYPRDGDCWALLEDIWTRLSHQRLEWCPRRGIRERCSHENLAWNCLCFYQIMPLWLLENSAAQLHPTNQKCQASPSQG